MNIPKQHPKIQALAFLGLILLLISVLPGCSGFGGLGVEPVTVTFVYYDSAADYGPLAEAFQQKYPNITIKLEPVQVSGGNPQQALALKLESADAVRISSTAVDAALIKTFLPLDTYITTDKSFPQEDLFSGSLEGLKVGGKQIGIPAALNPYVVYYNPSKFKAKGVTPPVAGWTLEDFMTSAMAMNNTDDALVGTPDYAFGFCSTPQFSDSIMFAFIFGGGIFDSITSPTTPTLNSPANIESLTWYAGLRNEFGIMPSSNDPREVGQLIVRSNCGFWMDWLDRSSFGRWMNDQDLAALPLPNYASQFTVSTLESYSILAKSEHPDETWKWINFLIQQPTAAGRLVPPLHSIIASDEYAQLAKADILGVARNMPQQAIVLGMEMYQDPRLGGAVELYSEATTKVLNKESDAMMALDAAQQQAEQSFGQ
ncbi:MAG: extracellular solute-binding protein [Anaerolineaceae bacterium]|nr:extracellular solute-binding protein [Anaerolineaceae bacterium]